MSNKLRIAIAIIAIFVIVSVFSYVQIIILENQKSDAESQLLASNQQIDDLNKANLQGFNYGYVGDNFTGMVSNVGHTIAYNAMLTLYGNGWTYNIQLGNIDPLSGVTFSENLPYPKTPEYALFLTELSWSLPNGQRTVG